MKKEKSMQGIDWMKITCAILVVAIHTEPLKGLGLIEDCFNIFTRFAVPFFYITSGYFLYKDQRDFSRLNKQGKRLIHLYGIWTIIYLPVLVIHNSRNGGGIKEYLTSLLWNGTFTQLWYLVASIYAIVILMILLRFLKIKQVLIIAIITYFVGVLISTYGPITSMIIGIDINVPTRNALFYAFPFMAFGLWLASNRENFFARKSNFVKIIGLLCSMIMVALEGYFLIIKYHTKQTMLWLFLPIGTAFLLELMLDLEFKDNKVNTIVLRKASTLIYTSHCLFQFILSEIGVGKGIIQFLCVMSISTAFSICIIALEKKMKFLKLLY